MDDIAEWLDPLPLKRTSPDTHLNEFQEHKSRKLSQTPAFLRNQSAEGLESNPDENTYFKQLTTNDDSDSSDEELIDCNWLTQVSNAKKMDFDSKNVLTNFIKKGESLLNKKSSYDVSDIMLRNPECMTNERKIPEEDRRRFNIDYLTKNPIMAEGVKNIPKTIENQSKSNFFTKKLLSPKLSRLFKPNTDIEETKNEKSKSKFFVQRPASPSNVVRSHRIRPVADDKRLEKNVLKSDIKLASLGKPMTPIFRRHLPSEKPEFADGRFSYRDRPKKEPKFIEIGRNRIKAPVQNIKETFEKPENIDKSKKQGISRSNYVSLANLKISKKDLEEKPRGRVSGTSPTERVI